MAAYLAEVYVTKSLNPAFLASHSTATPLEQQIQAHILEGNAAFFKRHYGNALCHYLAAWGQLPVLISPVFPS